VPQPVLEPRPLVRRRPDARRGAEVAAAALLAVLAFAALAAALRGPAFVDEVTIVNDSPFDVHVDVRAPGGRVLGLGTVPRGREMRFTSVLDQGDTWSFSFSSGDDDGGRVDLARRALERDGWRLTIPATTESRLERAGLSPAPETRTNGSSR
jgi:hypothetical protein